MWYNAIDCALVLPVETAKENALWKESVARDTFWAKYRSYMPRPV
jgi:hypothetical protein